MNVLVVGIALFSVFAVVPSAAALQFSSPRSGAVFAPGQPVSVAVTAGTGEVVQQVVFATSAGSVQAPAGGLAASVTIPVDAVGPEIIAAFASLVDGGVALAYVEVIVDAGPVKRLVVEAPPALLRIGQVMRLGVVGEFEDGVARDLTDADHGTTYTSSNPNVLAVHPTGVVQARTRGTAQVAVTSHGRSAVVTIPVRVPNPPDNRIPVPDAGPDQAVATEVIVDLDGRASADPDGDALEFLWQQESGPGVVIRDIETATPYFISPRVGVRTELRFSLVVIDSRGATSFPDVVRITVTPAVAPGATTGTP